MTFNSMLPKIIEVNNQHFIIYFKFEGTPDYKMHWSGIAAEIIRFTDGDWQYRSNHSADPVRNIDDARIMFEWSYCWRGVWEGLIHFKDSEYDCEEMKTMHELWEQIEATVKERIISDNPDYGAFD